MFEIDDDRLSPSRVTDRARDVAVEFVTGITYSLEQAMLMTWQGNLIPFHIERDNRRDSETGVAFVSYEFTRFGDSVHVAQARGVASFRFASGQDRLAATVLAIEGVLAFAHRFTHDAMDPDAIRVESLGRSWRISDFGYEERLRRP